VLSGSDISVPLSLKEPVYRVSVSLDRPDVDAYGARIPVQPGMLLRADIILERRTLIDWLLDPLKSVRS
jgi:membrane fusion protein